MSIPIDPSFSTVGPEWGVGSIGGTQAPASGGNFGGVLGKQLEQLSASQTDATQQASALATGQVQDPSSVVMAVERAQLEMQLATTLRNKGVEAIQELMRTQV
ncbi:MAG: flagellar hook-basal body complex protein FliE [Solirubrobacteraceae bacterium]|nr:flagellar hook-basal body complex protein FliE [Solirubrobacteraceae bacterium]